MLLVTVLAGLNFKFYPGLYIWKFSLDSNMYNIILIFLNHEFSRLVDRHSTSTEWFSPHPKPGSPLPFYPLFSMVFHISGIPQYLSFCEQLILVIFILSRSFNTMTYVRVSFRYKAVMLFHCWYRPSSFACYQWHVGCSHSLSVGDNAAMNMGVCKMFLFRWAPLLCMECGCF